MIDKAFLKRQFFIGMPLMMMIFLYLPNICVVSLQGIYMYSETLPALAYVMLNHVIMNKYIQSISRSKHSKWNESQRASLDQDSWKRFLCENWLAWSSVWCVQFVLSASIQWNGCVWGIFVVLFRFNCCSEAINLQLSLLCKAYCQNCLTSSEVLMNFFCYFCYFRISSCCRWSW